MADGGCLHVLGANSSNSFQDFITFFTEHRNWKVFYLFYSFKWACMQLASLPWKILEMLACCSFEQEINIFMSFFFSSANASPQFEGRGGEELGAMLAKTLERAYNHKSAIDLESLCILPGKQCWVLYIDALVW